jgi:hypothetical protein
MGTVKKRVSFDTALMLVLVLALSACVTAETPSGMPAPPPLPTQEEPTVLQMTGDVVLLRPLLAVRLAFGVVALPLAWPTAALLGDAGWAWEACVREPAHRLFARPIGRL